MTTTLTIKQTEVSPIEAYAIGMVINDSLELQYAVEQLSRANTLLDSVVEYKESKTKPLNATLKIIRDETRPLEDALKASIALIKSKMASYALTTEKASQEASDKLAARVGVNLSLESAAKRIADLPTVAPTVATDAGSVTFVTVKKFEVLDITLLPKDCILPNEVLIRKKMLAGEPPVPGVRYYEEKSIRNQRN